MKTITGGCQHNLAYQVHMIHFEVCARTFDKARGEKGTSRTTLVRPTGVDFIATRLGIELD